MDHFASKSGKLTNYPIFTRLVQLPRDIRGIQIHDEYEIDAEYRDRLNDIIQLRDVLRQQLPSQWFDPRGILLPDTSSIATITYSGYYFFVAIFAIISIGARCVSLCEYSKLVEIESG
ncbi:hypothetical protein BKA61DRAFT_720103 [Leptodontidium sp. MPI-SDFR-AT-0119]|nr:hypothetical protein BKA61DRAFT_720103 [Leptodontidium sp. MPI-SDFR-AT-0119]